jgi:hypothetical protein
VRVRSPARAGRGPSRRCEAELIESFSSCFGDPGVSCRLDALPRSASPTSASAARPSACRRLPARARPGDSTGRASRSSSAVGDDRARLGRCADAEDLDGRRRPACRISVVASSCADGCPEMSGAPMISLDGRGADELGRSRGGTPGLARRPVVIETAAGRSRTSVSNGARGVEHVTRGTRRPRGTHVRRRPARRIQRRPPRGVRSRLLCAGS